MDINTSTAIRIRKVAPPAALIAATVVPAHKRLAFLPTHFGDDYLRFERMLYFWACRLCKSFRGGFWDFYSLSNGGMYLALATNDRLHIATDTDYSGTMTADAAGIVITCHALCILSNESCDDRISILYGRLLEFAGEHAEAEEIFKALH